MLSLYCNSAVRATLNLHCAYTLFQGVYGDFTEDADAKSYTVVSPTKTKPDMYYYRNVSWSTFLTLVVETFVAMPIMLVYFLSSSFTSDI